MVYFTVHSKQTFLYFIILKEYRRVLFILIPIKMCNSGQDSKCLLNCPLELASSKGSWAWQPYRQLTSVSRVLRFSNPRFLQQNISSFFHIENCHENSSSAAARTVDFDKQQLFLPCMSQITSYQLPCLNSWRNRCTSWVGRAKRGDEIQKSPAVILHCLLPGAAVQARVCQIRFQTTPVLVYLIKMSYHSGRPSPRKIPWMAQS